MSKDLVSAAIEAKRKRRRQPGSTGTSFYLERGRPLPITMSEYRERRRDPDARIAVQLSRELNRLGEEFPRFRIFLNRWQHRILVQVRSPEWKRRAVLKCLRNYGACSIDNLIEMTKLDYVNVVATLEQLQTSGQVVRCNRAGGPVQRPDARAYWRRRE